MTSPYLTHAVDRLFARLTAVYGREFTGKFDGTTPDAVKAAWAHELRGFTHQLDSVAWALDHLPDKCPNAVQFRNLSRNAPTRAPAPMLPSDARTRGPNEIERETIRALAHSLRDPRRANREWAYRIIARHESGDLSPPTCVAMARRAIAADRSTTVTEDFE